MAHQKTTSKKTAGAASRVLPGKGSAKDAKSAGGSALGQKHAGRNKGSKRKG